MNSNTPALHKKIGLAAYGFLQLLTDFFNKKDSNVAYHSATEWADILNYDDKEDMVFQLSRLADHHLIGLKIENCTASCEKIFVRLECTASLKRDGGRGRVPTTLSLDLDHRDLNINNNIKYITHSKPKIDCPYWASKDPKTKCTDPCCRFGEFWAIYIKIKFADRWRAHSAYRRITKHMPSLCDVINRDAETRLKNHAQWRNKQYRPHATTYLNRREWEDPIIGEQRYVRSSTHSRLSAKAENIARVYDLARNGQVRNNRNQEESNRFPF